MSKLTKLCTLIMCSFVYTSYTAINLGRRGEGGRNEEELTGWERKEQEAVFQFFLLSFCRRSLNNEKIHQGSSLPIIAQCSRYYDCVTNHPQTQLKKNNQPFIMCKDSVGQDFRQSIIGKVCLCSTLLGPRETLRLALRSCEDLLTPRPGG